MGVYVGESGKPSMIKPVLGVLRRTNWSRLGGPLITFVTACVLGFLSTRGFSPENSASVMILVVAFSAFAGGLRPGLASAGISWVYFALAFSREGSRFRYDSGDLERLVVLAAITPAIDMAQRAERTVNKEHAAFANAESA